MHLEKFQDKAKLFLKFIANKCIEIMQEGEEIKKLSNIILTQINRTCIREEKHFEDDKSDSKLIRGYIRKTIKWEHALEKTLK